MSCTTRLGSPQMTSRSSLIRSTTAIFVVSQTCYAATQMSQWIKFEDASKTSSSHGEVTAPSVAPIPQHPKLQDNVSSSMFFC